MLIFHTCSRALNSSIALTCSLCFSSGVFPSPGVFPSRPFPPQLIILLKNSWKRYFTLLSVTLHFYTQQQVGMLMHDR